VSQRPKVVVCGTKFGRVYLAAFGQPDFPFELAGVLASGSQRSRRCAEAYGVPLYQSVDEVPDAVELACVVVGGSVTGGPGVQLAQSFLRRGIHVLQEHPVHRDELVACHRAAREAGVVYRLNTHYPHVEPVRRFIESANRLVQLQRPLFLDVQVAFQVAYTVFDILGRALPSTKPTWFAPLVKLPGPEGTARAHPYRSLDGVFGGVPTTFRLQNELVPAEPDNYSHLFHRITLGTEGGHLTLVNTHGPLLWSARPHLTADMAELIRFDESQAEHLDEPSAQAIGSAAGATYREVLGRLWPQAAGRAIAATWQDALAGTPNDAHVQYHLTLLRAWDAVAKAYGPVELFRRETPELLTAQDVGGQR